MGGSNTNVKLPGGGSIPNINMEIGQSSLGTGAGTPWSAGNQTDWGKAATQYGMEQATMTPGLGNLGQAAAGDNPYDIGGEDRAQRQRASQKAADAAAPGLAQQKAQQDARAQYQSSLDATNKAGAEQTEISSKGESAIMEALRKRKQGSQMFGGY